MLASAAASTAAETFSPEPARQLVRSIYEQLVNSNTSYTTGQTTPAAQAMAKRLLDAGFPPEDVVVAGAAPHKANVVVLVMGGTDGRLLRQAGIPTYGVQGIFFDVADIRFHGRDERLGVREFYEGQEFLYRLVKDLAR